jgi:hypothetical protein
MIHLYGTRQWKVSAALFVAALLFTSAGANAQTIRIDCGSESGHTDSSGSQWLADGYFSDGMAISGRSLDASNVYSTARVGVWSDFSYSIPVTNGTYKLTLKFAELQDVTRGQRVFNVIANNVWILIHFDIAERSRFSTEVSETAEIQITEGKLDLIFAGLAGRPSVSAIELEPINLQPQTPSSPSTPVGTAPPVYGGGGGGAATQVEAGGFITLEAESGSRIDRSGQTWALGTSRGGYSGSGYLAAQPNNGSNYTSGYSGSAPEARFPVQFSTPGTYYVWVRALGDSFADDSVHVGLDGSGSDSSETISEFPVSQRAWGWSSYRMDRIGRATIHVPSAGLHTVNLWVREDGILVDKLILTTSGSYTPDGSGPVVSVPVTPSSPPPATAPSTPPAGVPISTGNQFYVSPHGSASGNGSAGNPWDLSTALNHPAAVRPGDTIWLRGGTYGNSQNEFSSRLTGTSSSPIKVRQYPGERATINGGLGIHAPYTWFWGFEIMRNPRKNGADCIDTYNNSHGTRLINLIVHDCGSNGIGYWSTAGNSEIYGTLIYYNGFQAEARGAGHGIYLQNDNATGGKTIAENIIFKGHNLGIQAYGSENSRLRNVRIEGNIIFEPGVVQRDGNRVDAILVTVGSGSEDIIVESNYTYNRPGANDGYSRLGWQWSPHEKNIVARNNFFIGGESSLEMWNWNSLQFTNNVVYSMNGRICSLSHLGDQHLSNYNIGGNRYYGSGTFQYNGSSRSLDGMQSLGIERGSSFNSGAPTGVWAYARPNKYEPGRGHIVVYNWDQSSVVSVDVSNVLTPGANYEVRDAQNYFAAPVASGVYGGGSIQVPMTRTTVAAPSGSLPSAPVHTGPQFGAFVILTR